MPHRETFRMYSNVPFCGPFDFQFFRTNGVDPLVLWKAEGHELDLPQVDLPLQKLSSMAPDSSEANSGFRANELQIGSCSTHPSSNARNCELGGPIHSRS